MPLRYGNDRRCCERRGWLRLQQQMPGVHAVLTGEDWAADGLGTLDPEVMAEDMGGATAPSARRSRKAACVMSASASGLWAIVRDQVLAAGCLPGLHFSTPPEDEIGSHSRFWRWHPDGRSPKNAPKAAAL